MNILLFASKCVHLYDQLLMDGLPENFTHLAVHSHYSLLSATAAVDELAQLAAAQGLNALALTDTNGLYGVVAFAEACRAAGIKPLIGMTVYVAAPPNENPLATAVAGHLILLAQNVEGYRSLCRLSSIIQSGNQRKAIQQQGLDWAALNDHSSGLICITGGSDGWIERYIRAEQPAAAARIASRLGSIYQENVFLSFDPRHKNIAKACLTIGERFGLQPVAVQPVYYLQPQDAPRLRLLAAIDQNCRLADVKNVVGDGRCWLTPQEIATHYADYPEALTNTAAIATHCQEVLPDGRPIWPALDLPQDQTPDIALTTLAQAGLMEKYGPTLPENTAARLERELASINRHGFAPLFLLVADIVGFARRTTIPVNTRGSVANSLVAYCVGITNVDPIEHDLLFERFLNPARANLPDIDLDFCSRRRDEVLEYVRHTYGADRVALVATVSTMQPKSAVRETAKAYGLAEAKIKKLTALWRRRWHPDPQRRQGQQLADVLAELEDALSRTIMREAHALFGQPHHLSIHPGGIVITPGPLTDVVPLQMAPKGFLITQFDYRDVEKIGLPKIDLLGIRALTVLADTAVAIQQNHDPDFRLDKLPLDDEATAQAISQGQTIGVFQCESSGAQRTLRQLKAHNVADLAIANAFFKPGPATGGMAKSFIRRYRGEERVSYLHPALEPILHSTQGVLIFQEQVLRIAWEIAGLSWAQADHLRRGMSKFQATQMAAMARQFILGCQRPVPDGHGLSREQAKTLWEQVLAFAGYGFNQGHATAYADVSYRSAYLKTHYPAEFLCARLADHGGFHHPAIYMAEAQRLGIIIKPPHINHSHKRFTLTQQSKIENHQCRCATAAPLSILWMGLGQVRDLRRQAVMAIVAERIKRPFVSLRDLLQRVHLQPKEVLHLIQCGALDGLADSRAALLAEAEPVARAGSAQQLAFAFAVDTAVAPESSAQRLAWERQLLGQPISVHPLELVDVPETAVALRELPQMRNQRVTAVGVRLPGWTGGKGFFLGDGDTFVIVNQAGQRKKWANWQVLKVNGRWRVDEWGNGWLQAEDIKTMV